jgi:hypothetical protein
VVFEGEEFDFLAERADFREEDLHLARFLRIKLELIFIFLRVNAVRILLGSLARLVRNRLILLLVRRTQSLRASYTRDARA